MINDEFEIRGKDKGFWRGMSLIPVKSCQFSVFSYQNADKPRGYIECELKLEHRDKSEHLESYGFRLSRCNRGTSAKAESSKIALVGRGTAMGIDE